MKIQSKTIILLLLLIVSLISLLSYFFFTKYKFLLEYIDNRIDLKNQKIIEKYNLNQVYENNKEQEQKYLDNLKDNLENFNNTLSQTNFIDQITELSDIEEEDEDIYSNEEDLEIKEEFNFEEPELQLEEPIHEPAGITKLMDKESTTDQEIILNDELPNLENLDDSVDDYIKQILENNDDIDLSNITEIVEKKKIDFYFLDTIYTTPF